MAIYESGEDYLETILILQNKNGHVRSVDIATHLGYSKPSIILKRSDYILVDEKGLITFTDKGKALAERIYDRHNNISKFLMDVLGVSEENAVKDACRIEHDLSEETYQKMREHLLNQ